MSFRTFAIVAALLLATQSSFAANITARDWGTTSKGEKVKLFTLKTGVRHGLVVEISNFGGVMVRLMAPDREGVLRALNGSHARQTAARDHRIPLQQQIGRKS